MARSTNVYVVNSWYGSPIAAFTVKHELVTWLRKQPPIAFILWRVPDGGPRTLKPNRMKVEFEPGTTYIKGVVDA